MVSFPLVCVYTSLLLLSALPSPDAFSVLTTTRIRSSIRLPPPQHEKSPTIAPHLIFPGGGIFFYWQAGAVTYLREQGYNLTATTATGASAGSLTATLTATNVDFYKATALALDMAAQAGIWDRTGGLQGIWGPLISDWLDQLLPDNALALVDNRLSLLVTPVPSFGKERIETFQTRQELIEGNLASVHIPWFLDGRLVTEFRKRPFIDGSFLAKEHHYLPGQPQDTLILDYNQDPAYQQRGFLEFVEAVSPDGIWNMLEDGKRYAKILEEQGALEIIPKLDL